jgi:hypothetical protein
MVAFADLRIDHNPALWVARSSIAILADQFSAVGVRLSGQSLTDALRQFASGVFVGGSGG